MLKICKNIKIEILSLTEEIEKICRWSIPVTYIDTE